MSLTIPACLLAGFAPSSGVLFAARVLGGLAAGMAYPTTLALITALWSGPGRTKSIALWSALGGGIALLGPLISGWLLEHFSWGSVFLVTLPLVAVALPMAIFFVPSHVNEGTERVDNLGGMLSAVFVGGLIVAINFLPVPTEQTVAIVLFVVAAVAAVMFFVRQRRAANPLYDLHVAARPTFWVAACAGIIVFGSLMGAAYISQQFLQNVLGYSTLDAGAAIIPAGLFMVAVAPRSAKLVGQYGSRRTLLSGQSFLFVAFLLMLLIWKENIPYWEVAIPYIFLGIGVGLAGTPSSNSLTGSVPVTRVGMASGTADLQRDLGGALMTSIFGALLTAGYATAMAGVDSSTTQSTQATLQLSYSSAEDLAAQHPALREPDHGGRPVVVPQGRPVGLPGRDDRDPDRDGARLPLLPEEGRRERPAGRVPRPRHGSRAGRRADAGPSPSPALSRRPARLAARRARTLVELVLGLEPEGQLDRDRPDRGVDERAERRAAGAAAGSLQELHDRRGSSASRC